MAEPDTPESPLEAAAGVAGDRTTQAFSILGNEMRLAIMLALWESIEPYAEGKWTPRGAPMPFSDLRKRVGMPDSGQFNYHLGKMEGLFVEQTDEGYRLLPAGNRIVQSIIGVSGFHEETLQRTKIGLDCPICGAQTAVLYRKNRLYHVCTACDGYYDFDGDHPAGMLGGWGSGSAAVLKDRDPQSMHSAVRTQAFHSFGQTAAEVCPNCGGYVRNWLAICDDHKSTSGEPCPECGRADEAAALALCNSCKYAPQGIVPDIGLRHPAVIAFYWKHGIELGHDIDDTAKLLVNVNADADQELVSRDPPRLQVTYHHTGDEIRLTYDENMKVSEITEPG